MNLGEILKSKKGFMTNVPKYGLFLIVKRQLIKLKFTDILDAGCGSGFYSKYVATNFPHARVVALDLYRNIFEEELKTDFKHNERITFAREDYRKLPFKDKFDLVLCISAGIGALADTDRVATLANFYKALKHDGVLLLSLGKGYDVPGNLFRAKRKPVLGQLEAAGFKIDVVKHIFGNLSSFTYKMDRLTSGHKLLRAFLIPLLKVIMYCDTRMYHKIGNGMIIVARKP